MTITKMALLKEPTLFEGWRDDLVLGEDFGDDELGEDDFGDDELGEDDFGDDELGEDEDEDDFGASRRRRRGSRRRRRLSKRGSSTTGKKKMANKWGMTILSNSVTTSGTTSASLSFRLQHHFLAEDITAIGSTAGARITSIMFGDRVIWSVPGGAPVELFAVNGMVRKFLDNQRIPAGLDITIAGTVATAGDTLSITLVGRKPLNNC